MVNGFAVQGIGGVEKGPRACRAVNIRAEAEIAVNLEDETNMSSHNERSASPLRRH